MNLSEKFPSNISGWVRYSRYEIQTVSGYRRIIPAKDAKPMLYNPLENAVDILLDVLNLGQNLGSDITETENNLLEFARKHGLLGICTDIILNDNFMDGYNTDVFVAKNCFMRDGAYTLTEYIDSFFDHDFQVLQSDTLGNLSGREDIYDALFSAGYGEYTHWLATYMVETYDYFKACIGYGEPEQDKNYMEIINRDISKKLRYVVTAEAKPTLQWIFPSLKAVVDMALAQCVTAGEKPLKICKKCTVVYYNENARSEFCSGRCRNQWNVYKSRGR